MEFLVKFSVKNWCD